MPKFIPRTKQQNSALHVLLAKHKFTNDDKAQMVFDMTDGRTEHSSEMSFDEANRMIVRLGGTAFSSPVSSQSRRTVQHHRQKAGIAQIVTPEHLEKLNTLWFKKAERTQAGLEALSLRIIKVENHAQQPNAARS